MAITIYVSLTRFPASGPPAYSSGFIFLLWSLISAWLIKTLQGPYFCLNSIVPKIWLIHPGYWLLLKYLDSEPELTIPAQLFFEYSVNIAVLCTLELQWLFDVYQVIRRGTMHETQWKHKRVRVSAPAVSSVPCIQNNQHAKVAFFGVTYPCFPQYLSLYICVNGLMFWIRNF